MARFGRESQECVDADAAASAKVQTLLDERHAAKGAPQQVKEASAMFKQKQTSLDYHTREKARLDRILYRSRGSRESSQRVQNLSQSFNMLIRAHQRKIFFHLLFDRGAQGAHQGAQGAD